METVYNNVSCVQIKYSIPSRDGFVYSNPYSMTFFGPKPLVRKKKFKNPIWNPSPSRIPRLESNFGDEE